MRGSPLFQTLILIVVLQILGYAGLQYLGDGTSEAILKNNESRSMEPEESSDSLPAEVELIFSTPPSSYVLAVAPIAGEGEVKVLFSSGDEIENPAYHDITTIKTGEVDYWLDVRWKTPPEDNSQYFTKVIIIPETGEQAEYTFSTPAKRINGVINYMAKGELSDE